MAAHFHFVSHDTVFFLAYSLCHNLQMFNCCFCSSVCQTSRNITTQLMVPRAKMPIFFLHSELLTKTLSVRPQGPTNMLNPFLFSFASQIFPNSLKPASFILKFICWQSSLLNHRYLSASKIVGNHCPEYVSDDFSAHIHS